MNNDIQKWAMRHNISNQCYVELMQALTGRVPPTTPQPPSEGRSESYVQSSAILEASQCGARLWRNNVGACKDETGRVIRYGLANESKQLNAVCKSSDLIGLKPVMITPQHVGLVIGQFVAREVKKQDWTFSNTKHEQAQQNFLNIVNKLGGDGKFITGKGQL